MSICLTWFPISGLGKPKYIPEYVVLDYKNRGDFTWRVFLGGYEEWLPKGYLGNV